MAKIVMIGATGLIGRSLAPMLVDAGHEVSLFSRRDPGVAGALSKVAESRDWPDLLEGTTCDCAISTLGTTWRKAGSWERFEAIDRTAVVAFARAARTAGARQMISVSSVGADPLSGNRYLALKGMVEQDIADLGFERFDIIRPGLLRGERGDDRRLLERAGIIASPVINLFLRGRMDRYRAIDAERVAQAIANLAGGSGKGRHVHQNREIEALSGE